MRKCTSIAFCLLFAGLLSACGSETFAAVPVPARLREGPLPEKAAARMGKICELLVFLGNRQDYAPGPSGRTFITLGAEAYPGAPLGTLSRLLLHSRRINSTNKYLEFRYSNDETGIIDTYRRRTIP